MNKKIRMIKDGQVHELDGLEGLAKFVGGRAVERMKALEMVEREGGLNRFEAKMFRLAKLIFEQEDSDPMIAMLILNELATEVGFRCS
jgi:hypothetical protein